MPSPREQFQDAVAVGVAEGLRRSQEEQARQVQIGRSAASAGILAAVVVAVVGCVLFAATNIGWFFWGSIAGGVIAWAAVSRAVLKQKGGTSSS